MAARYRPIEPRLWDSPAFRSLAQSLKLLWLYLISGPGRRCCQAFSRARGQRLLRTT